MDAVNSPAIARAQRFTAKGQATRARIIQVASKLMLEKGVSGTSLDEVQKAAGVSGSQLYHYFGTKNALVQEVIALQGSLVLGALEPLVVGLDSFEGLERWRDYYVDERERIECIGGCLLGSFAGEVSELDETCRQELVANFDKWELPLRVALTAMRDRGELRQDAEPETLSTALLAALQGGTLLSQVQRSSRPLHLALTTVIDQIRTYAADRLAHFE
ncbi:transcriptional regulator [Streptomyces spiralis]|uniref:Transcriptional regulator n=1 Tax=Streptomyces spiralis TaxID=66376 RepID=A0A919DLT1_9ACTN|nr:TetR/AcrR family transcriptional regulator [Streptomyces spiralis]GHE55212.1 transcriptional regulator [Streptomyces spiralis]